MKRTALATIVSLAACGAALLVPAIPVAAEDERDVCITVTQPPVWQRICLPI